MKKEHPILVGILLLIASAVAFSFGSDYVWVLFGVIELPMWVPGGLLGLVGIIRLISGIKAKKG